VRFVLIGYLDVQNTPWQSGDRRFTVHGRYQRRELAALLAQYRARLVLYPSAGPETFSYTLSESWAAGIPVFVPPIGALGERVQGSGAGWVMSDDEWRDEAAMLARIVALVGDANRSDLERAAIRARAMPHAALDDMADATFALYRRAVERSSTRPAFRPLSATRIRDALGYRAWTPPSTAPPGHVEPVTLRPMPNDVGARVAHAALAIRHTVIGRALYRMTPRPVLSALKARLKP